MIKFITKLITFGIVLNENEKFIRFDIEHRYAERLYRKDLQWLIGMQGDKTIEKVGGTDIAYFLLE